MTKKVLLKYGVKAIKLGVDETQEFHPFMLQRARLLFGISTDVDVTLQFWDEDFNDWVDLEDDHIPENFQKFRVEVSYWLCS